VPIRLARPLDPLSVDFLDYQKELLRHLGQGAANATSEVLTAVVWAKPVPGSDRGSPAVPPEVELCVRAHSPRRRA
jgi:hypothetical protein